MSNIIRKKFMKIDKLLILNRIKEHYSFKKDSDFARFLDIKPQTLNSWYVRNTFDIDLLYAKCVGIDGNFLLTGEGEMWKNENIINDKSTSNELLEKNYFNTVKEKEALIETNELLRFKIRVLEKELSEVTNTQRETTISKSMVGSKPELKKEGNDAKK